MFKSENEMLKAVNELQSSHKSMSDSEFFNRFYNLMGELLESNASENFMEGFYSTVNFWAVMKGWRDTDVKNDWALSPLCVS